MILRFDKYHGAGNDFILVDHRQGMFNPSRKIIQALCDRRFGIGADGLMLLGPSTRRDFSMRYYNSDGGEGSMCGNGGRCITAYARKLGIIGREAAFKASDGDHFAEIISGESGIFQVKLGMNDLTEIRCGDGYDYVNTGSPHHVVFVEDPDLIDVVAEGRKIRYGEPYGEKGTNVDFVGVNNGKLYVRTYERGVEDETLSCGTGVTAAALVYAHKNKTEGPVEIRTKGGSLRVTFSRQDNSYTNIMLEGPVTHVFSGEIELDRLNSTSI